jgi:hypothetical protein
MRPCNFLILSFLTIISYSLSQLNIDLNSLSSKDIFGNNTIIQEIVKNPEKYSKQGLAEFLLKNKDLLDDPIFIQVFPYISDLVQGKTNNLGELYEKIGNFTLNFAEKNNDKYKDLIILLRNFLYKGGYVCGPYAKAFNYSDLSQEDGEKINKEIEQLKNYLSILNDTTNFQIKNIYDRVFSMSVSKNLSMYPNYIDNIEIQLLSLNTSVITSENDKSFIKNVRQFIKRMKYLCKDEKSLFKNTTFYKNEFQQSNNSSSIDNSSYYFNSQMNTPIPQEEHNKHYNKPDDEDNYSPWGKPKRCNPYECDGCCINNVCKPEEECVYSKPAGNILAFIISILFCCGCCMCFWWGLGLLILRCRRRFRYQRQVNERSNEMPVTGIPVTINRVVTGEIPTGGEIRYANVNNSDKSLGNTDSSFEQKI